MSKVISFCIPTYNRKNFLIEALESINNQDGIEDFKDKLEIVISDNASTDGTEEAVKEYAKKSKVDIIYKKQDKNMGIDRNILNVVGMATGEYCWLMGDDDCIINTGVKKVLEEVKSSYDIYLLERYCCYKDNMKEAFRKEYFLKGFDESVSFDFAKEGELRFYFSRCSSMMGIFSFLSIIVVKREAWNKVEGYEDYIGTIYIHVYMLLNLVYKFKCRLKYLREHIVLCRMGNDGFFENHYQRFMLDINGYEKISEVFEEKDNELRKDFLAVFNREYDMLRCLKLSIRLKKEEREKFYEVIKKIGYNETEIEYLKNLNKSRWIFLAAFGWEKIITKFFEKRQKI